MRKIFQRKRWKISAIITLITLVIGFLYLKLTNQLNLFLDLKWQAIDRRFLEAFFGGILINWISTFLYPNSDKRLLKAAGENGNKLDGIKQGQDEMYKMVAEALAKKSDRSLDDIIKENQELKEKLQRESIAGISKELQAEIDQFVSEFKYPEARNSIDIFLKTHENIKQKDLAKLHYRKSLIYEAEINYQKAKEENETAIALDRVNPEIANQYGNILDILGDYDKAIKYYEDALRIRLKTFGEEHPDVAESYNNLGTVWDSKGDYNKAIKYHEDALRIRLKTFGEEHPDVADIYNNLGIVWEHKDDHEKAIKYYEDALKILYKAFPDGHPRTDSVEKKLRNVQRVKNT